MAIRQTWGLGAIENPLKKMLLRDIMVMYPREKTDHRRSALQVGIREAFVGGLGE